MARHYPANERETGEVGRAVFDQRTVVTGAGRFPAERVTTARGHVTLAMLAAYLAATRAREHRNDDEPADEKGEVAAAPNS